MRVRIARYEADRRVEQAKFFLEDDVPRLFDKFIESSDRNKKFLQPVNAARAVDHLDRFLGDVVAPRALRLHPEQDVGGKAQPPRPTEMTCAPQHEALRPGTARLAHGFTR